MDMDLKGKAVLVTGSAAGIGKATLFAFAEEGARVAAVDIDEAGAKLAVEEARRRGAERAIAVRADISKLDDARRACAAVAEQLGGLDVLVNLAAAWRNGRFMDLQPEDWQFTVNMVLVSTMTFCRAGLEQMLPRKKGVIINVGSDAGRVGEPGMSLYSASKAGVITFSKALAKEVASQGIRVNVVCPGFTPVERHERLLQQWRDAGDLEKVRHEEEWRAKAVRNYPLRRFGTPEDTAYTIVYMASERASYITGQTLSVNGGYSML